MLLNEVNISIEFQENGKEAETTQQYGLFTINNQTQQFVIDWEKRTIKTTLKNND